MTTEEMNKLYADIAVHDAAGDVDAAKARLMKDLPRLPEELRTKIMLEMFTSALESEEVGLAFKRTIQEDGLRAAEEIEKQKGEES